MQFLTVQDLYAQYHQFPFYHALIAEIIPYYEESRKGEELSIEIPSE